MNRILLFCGGQLGEWALKEIRDSDLLVGADKGALFLLQHGRTPDIALGDFDSVTENEREFIQQKSRYFAACDPVDKDLTDSEMAFQWALSQKPEEIVMLGVLGTRFDHSLANIHLLRAALSHGVDCCIVDMHNRIRLTADKLSVRPSAYSHVSLLPLSETVTGINLTGFLYPLQDAVLTIGQTLGISNVLTGESGIVQVKEGFLLVIESRD